MTIEDVVRERGPMTVAAFMDLALNHPQLGYYARAAQRSGRAGDFFTSVDVGPTFGALLAVQIEEMFDLLSPATAASASSTDPTSPEGLDLVEAGAGNARLAADILRAARRTHPTLYERVRLHLVETSPQARLAQVDTLGEVADRLASSCGSLPSSFQGVLVANELLDAFPVHQVVMREDGLREIYVVGQQLAGDNPLTTVEGPLSTPALAEYFARLGMTLEPGWRAEVNLQAIAWIRQAARGLRRGFIMLIDYGHEAHDLYSVSHSAGTLTTFSQHTVAGPDSTRPAWLEKPGDRDFTAHVDFTSLRAAAEAEGLRTLGFMDQTYFLLGIATGSEMGLSSPDALNLHDRLALKTLLMPGGLGSTHKVLIFGRDVGAPQLRGCSFGQRVT